MARAGSKKLMPRTVRVGYMDIRVVVVPADDLDEAQADYQSGKARIRVSDQVAGRPLAASIMHEIMHAIWDLQGLRQEALSASGDELEETVVTAMSNGMSQVIRDNPGLMSWMVQELG